MLIGDIFFTEGLPCEAGRGQSAIPATTYVLLTPLRLLSSGWLTDKQLIQLGNALLESCSAMLIWLLLRRVGAGRRAALLGAALYIVAPPLSPRNCSNRLQARAKQADDDLAIGERRVVVRNLAQAGIGADRGVPRVVVDAGSFRKGGAFMAIRCRRTQLSLERHRTAAQHAGCALARPVGVAQPGYPERVTPWPYPLWIAHRGAGTLAPENTLAAFRVGLARGYRAFECDVKLSADDVPFLLHDATLERTTNGRGRAGRLAWTELARLDAGSWHGLRHAGEPLARLDDVSAVLLEAGAALNIEMKPTPGTEGHTGTVVARHAARVSVGPSPPPLLSSFSREALRSAKAAEPGLPRALILETLHEGWFELALELGCARCRAAPPADRRVARCAPSRVGDGGALLHRQQSRRGREAACDRYRWHRRRRRRPGSGRER